MLPASARLCLRDGHRLQWEPGQQAWVLLFPEGMVRLNDAAALVLQECRRPVTPAELVERLQARFPDVALADDIHDFLEDAHGQRWLDLC